MSATLLLRFVPALVWASVIFLLSSREKLPEIPLAFTGIDKLAHALAYGILCALLLWAQRPRLPRALLTWVAVSTLYGASDELHQRYVPGRSADVLDLVADLSGALGAAVLWVKRRPNTQQEER